ncbi:MAG TPA: hypothetical protein DHN33_03945 [Eubacteriaceae bacterium]|nr:hypothetical protein [Eubacteriaceae bacterium]
MCKNSIDSRLKSNIMQKENHISFHMPGHKGRSPFAGDLADFDTTELDGTDNLADPKKEIQSIEREISKTIGSQQTMISVNGASAALMACLLGTFQPNDKIVLSRDVHKSVYSALAYGRFQPVYLYPKKETHYGIYPSGWEMKELESLRKKHPDIKGLVLTHPNYYGICPDIDEMVRFCQRNDILLIIDEAHGSHLPFTGEEGPKSAVSMKADALVHSTHKTLSALNQGAVIHILSNRVDSKRIKRHLNMVQTTSPSYPILLSVEESYRKVDAVRKAVQLWRDGKEKVRETIKKTRFKLVEDFPECRNMVFDPAKLWIDKGGIDNITGLLANQYGIDIEMEDEYTMVAMAGVGTLATDYHHLADALVQIDREYRTYDGERRDNECMAQRKIEEKTRTFPKNKIRMPIWEAVFQPTEVLPPDQAIGKIAGEFVMAYPPGLPIIVPGEEISQELGRCLKHMDQSRWIGLDQGGRISVIKE